MCRSIAGSVDGVCNRREDRVTLDEAMKINIQG